MDHPYASQAYVQALAEAEGGAVIDVPEWRCRLVRRPIAGGLTDAAGPYPRTPLPPGADLAGGLERLRDAGLVSVVLVPDPLTAPAPAALEAAFAPARPFKTHYVIDRAAGGEWPSKNHRYKIRRALRRVALERAPLAAVLADWTRLYAGLKARHEIAGAADFSPAYFAALADDPRHEAFVARIDGVICAMSLWFAHEGVAVYHLGASDEAGYGAGASYALFDAAIEHFADARRLDLGGAAGLTDDPDDGLARFKQGFANARANAWLCGAVLDAAAYARLAGGRGDSFFPAYRG